MAALHNKHCCPVNATLSKMPGSLRLQSAHRDILPVCSELEKRQVGSGTSNEAGVAQQARLMTVSVVAATGSSFTH